MVKFFLLCTYPRSVCGAESQIEVLAWLTHLLSGVYTNLTTPWRTWLI